MQLGIDIGGTSVKAAGVENGRCLWTGQSGFYAEPTTEELRTAIRTAAGGRAAGVVAIGLCVPGLFDADERKITEAFNVPGLVGIPLDCLVPQSLDLPAGKPARICNDAQAAAFDVFQSRRIRGRLLVLTLGTGVGIAVLDEGRPLCVEGESPGHIGQIDVSIAGHDVVGPDGGAGGLEGYLGVAASAPITARTFRPPLPNSPATSRPCWRWCEPSASRTPSIGPIMSASAEESASG